MKTGRYPYGAAITRDGKQGLISNEADGTVSVIDLAGRERGEGDHGRPAPLPPGGDRRPTRRPTASYVAVTHQDLVAVIDTKKMEVERTLSVERPQGLGTAPVARQRHRRRPAAARQRLRRGRRRRLRTAGDHGRRSSRLGAARRRGPPARGPAGRRAGRDRARGGRRDLRRRGRGGVEAQKAARPVLRKPKAWELIGRESRPRRIRPGRARRRASASSCGSPRRASASGPNSLREGETVPDDPGSATGYAPSRSGSSTCRRTRSGASGVLRFPTDRRLRKLTPARVPPDPPDQRAGPAGRHAAQDAGPGAVQARLLHRAREPHLRPGPRRRPARRRRSEARRSSARRSRRTRTRWRERFPLLDHVYANSEASIDGHFWTSAAAVSDYVAKNWHAELRRPRPPYDFGVYSVTWPAQGFLFDQAQKQGISWFNFGEAIAGVGAAEGQRPHAGRRPTGGREVPQVGPRHDAGSCGRSRGGRRRRVLPERRLVGGSTRSSAGPGPDVEVYDSPLPSRATPAAGAHRVASRASTASSSSSSSSWRRTPCRQFNYMMLANDHTAGTRPGRRTPRAMIAENDWALGETVDLISKSPIWKELADPRDRGRLAGRRRPRRRAPDPRARDQPVRREGRGRPHALRLPVVHPHARDRRPG